MKKLFVFHLLLAFFTAHAQDDPNKYGVLLDSIAHLDIGWIKIYQFTTPPKPKEVGGRTYSAAQLRATEQLIQWMQQSYIPKGCLGDANTYVNPVSKVSNTNSALGNAINTQVQALPHMYGARSKMYTFIKKNAAGKWVPALNFEDNWNIEANGLQRISEPVWFISNTKDYYFVMPDFANHPKGYYDEHQAISDLKGFRNHKNIAAYRRFYIPSKTIDDNPYFVVIMSKDKELPFEPITIVEFLTAAEQQLPVWQSVDPKPESLYVAAQKNLARLKEKYRAKWNETAQLRISGVNLTLVDLANLRADSRDFFDNKDYNGNEGRERTFPVLKVKKSAMELCKTDTPQWLVIRWQHTFNKPYSLHLHESILNNFNFAYVYDYFFNPEKVKGQPYKPLRSPLEKEPIMQPTASETSRNAAADANTFFFDDFSTTPVNSKPNGWITRLETGTTAIVLKPDGLDGNWAEMKGYYIGVTLRKSWPQNFTLTYDVAVPQNFTWGARGLTMRLSKELKHGVTEAFLDLTLRPGFSGRDGEAVLEAHHIGTSRQENRSKFYTAVGFSNNKKINRVGVTLLKRGETVQVFIDKTKIAEWEKILPADQQFTTLSFNCNGNKAETDKYFISNIKIKSD